MTLPKHANTNHPRNPRIIESNMPHLSNTQQLTRVCTLVEDIHHRLFGNGQPGFIKDSEDRIKSLENYRSYVRGALVVISMVAGAAITYIVERQFGVRLIP